MKGTQPSRGRALAAAAALAALATALVAPSGPARAATAEALLGVCAPAGGGPPTPACYGYVQAIIDDANLVGAHIDRRFVTTFGLFCAPSSVNIDEATAAVVRALRADPSLRGHSAAIAVRLALPRVYPCTQQVLRHPPAR